MPFVDLSPTCAPAGRMYYEDHGQGQPVVLIHGWPLSGRTWEAQLPALVDAGYRVITYDRRGFGESSQPWAGYDYDTMSDDLDGLMDALDLRGATLVGFSMGGGEVARYIGRHGTDRVARAVFAAAVTPYLYRSAAHPEGAVTDADIAEKQAGVRKDRLAFLEKFTHNFFTPKGGKLAVSEDQRLYAKAIGAMASSQGTHDCVAAFSTTDFRPDLARCDLPTLVLHGDSDQIVPLEVSGARTHQAVAGSQLHVIAGGPHGCNLSHAAAFNQALLKFLQST